MDRQEASLTITPPHPRSTIRVAVTGHRWDRLLPAHADKVERQVATLLARIGAFTAQVSISDTVGYEGGAPDLVLLSGLAQGSDTLGATAALATPGWRLHAVLPFARSLYERDFAEPGSLTTFHALLDASSAVTELDGRAGEYDAYLPLGRVLIEQCDLLIAVWDGKRARGPGGTANVVELARRSDVPIIRIDASDPGAMWLEALSEPGHGRNSGLLMLDSRLAALLAAPALASARDHDLREAWFGEQLPRRGASRAFDVVVALFHRRPADKHSALSRLLAAVRRRYTPAPPSDPGLATRAAWLTRWTSMDEAVRESAFARFAAYHGWADELAKWYAAEFRGSFTWIFSLAWVAVVAALLGALARTAGQHGWAIIARIVEVVALALTLRRVVVGRRNQLHERWMEYRSLAERLRHLAVLWPIGRSTPLVRVPQVATPGDPRLGWVGWMLRAVAREAGLASGRWDPERYRTFLRDGELRPQRAFHFEAMRRARSVHHPLERATEIFFIAALVLAAGNVAFELLTGGGGEGPPRAGAGLAATLEALGVALPALAASVHGFLGTSDLEGLALRSASIEPRLADLEWRLEHLDSVDTTSVGDVAVEAARVMEGELGSWRTVAESRRLQMG